MFTGIIETMGEITAISEDQDNRIFTIASSISNTLKVDQSIAHNGVCLTVTSVDENSHQVVAVAETLEKSNFNFLKIGDLINLERSVSMQKRLDGHMVQGHVDCTIQCLGIASENGSWRYTFELPAKSKTLVVDKGSICINGVSLTVILSEEGKFSVAIIPYTFDHTNFQTLKVGETANVEFDILGKYVLRYLEQTQFKLKSNPTEFGLG